MILSLNSKISKILLVLQPLTKDYLPDIEKRAKEVDIKDCSVEAWLRLRPEECDKEALLKTVIPFQPSDFTRRKTLRLGVLRRKSEGDRRNMRAKEPRSKSGRKVQG